MTLNGTSLDQSPYIPGAAPLATVTINAENGTAQSVALKRAASVFGTKAGCKFVLRHPTVQRRHCVVVNTGEQLILRDLLTNGQTFRNGLKVEQEFLEDDDRIRVGPWEFRVRIQTKTDVGGMDDSPAIIDLEPDPTVLAIEDLNTGQLVKLSREVSTLGRSPGNDFLVQDREVSSVHAVIFTYLHKPAVFDLVSENGTFVNGKRCTFAMLANGDEIALGGCKLRFRCNGPSPSSTNGTARTVLTPKPFANPESTLSDFIDLSAESMLNRK